MMVHTTLVTGASGFTGLNLCRKLCAAGDSVIGLVRETSDVRPLEAIGVDSRAADLTNPADVASHFENVDRVFHIAAVFREEPTEVDTFRRVNVGGTENVLAASLATGVKRVVHCSTVGVHGAVDDPPADEKYRYKPGDPYQRSKLEGERVAHRYMKLGLPVSVVRPGAIYGPGDTRLLKLFQAIARGRFVLIGSGEVCYHLVYVDDLVEGLLLAASHPAAAGEIFIVAGPRYISLNELVSVISEAVGRPVPRLRIPFLPVYAAAAVCEAACRVLRVSPPLYRRRVEFFHKNRAFDITKARTVLGYEPCVGVRDGIARTANWYRENGYL
jgi:nucleoside-diphosphate-sugar epimerase